MKKSIGFIFLVIVSVSSSFSQSKRTEVADPTAFKPIPIIRIIENCRVNSVTKCGETVLAALGMLGFGGEDNFTERKEVFRFGNNTHIFLFSVLATKPSFTNEWRIRAAFIKTSDGFKFVQAGIQHRCWTGQTRSNWQKNECAASNSTYDPTSQTPQNEIENLDEFQFIAITGKAAGILSEACSESLENCGNKIFSSVYKPDGFEEVSAKNIKRETFSIKQGRLTKGIFLVTLTGYEDDSLGGERIRIEFQKNGNLWIAQSGSKQFLCRRGAFADRWTKEFCH